MKSQKSTPPADARTPEYRIAGRLSDRNLTGISTGGEFAARLRELILSHRPRRLIETGTYHGTGTTTIVAHALRDAGLDDATFFSVEVNPRHYSRALAHVTRDNLNVKLLNGLSVPRDLLPSRREIEQRLVRQVIADQLIVDHEPERRVELYFRETDFPHLPDDLIGTVLSEFGEKADFILLDSGGHMGYVEFKYVTSRLRAPCWIAMDDVMHVKHHQSFAEVQADARFRIEHVGREKFGFCIARFTPSAGVQPARRKGSAA
jgi:hypothetical protein